MAIKTAQPMQDREAALLTAGREVAAAVERGEVAAIRVAIMQLTLVGCEQ